MYCVHDGPEPIYRTPRSAELVETLVIAYAAERTEVMCALRAVDNLAKKNGKGYCPISVNGNWYTLYIGEHERCTP